MFAAPKKVVNKRQYTNQQTFHTWN